MAHYITEEMQCDLKVPSKIQKCKIKKLKQDNNRIKDHNNPNCSDCKLHYMALRPMPILSQHIL